MLSHLGSGAVILGQFLSAGRNGEDPPGRSSTRTLASYYAGFAASIGNNAALSQWQDGFDDRAFGDEGVVSGCSETIWHASLLSWSSDAWVYALTNARIPLPTGPIYNDEFLVTGSVNVIETVTAF